MNKDTVPTCDIRLLLFYAYMHERNKRKNKRGLDIFLPSHLLPVALHRLPLFIPHTDTPNCERCFVHSI